jgi:excisionase family DNA binding protein
MRKAKTRRATQQRRSARSRGISKTAGHKQSASRDAPVTPLEEASDTKAAGSRNVGSRRCKREAKIMRKAKARKARRNRIPPSDEAESSYRAVFENPRLKQAAAGFRDVRRRHYRGSGLPRSYSIKTIAEAEEVSSRTVRRWIKTGRLIAHQIDGLIRITDDDFRAFWARYRGA